MNHISFEHLQNLLANSNRATVENTASEFFYNPLQCTFDDPLFGKGETCTTVLRNEVVLNQLCIELPEDIITENFNQAPLVAMFFMLGGKGASVDGKDQSKLTPYGSKGDCILFTMPAGVVYYELLKQAEKHHAISVLFTYQSFVDFARDYMDLLPEDIKSTIHDTSTPFCYTVSMDEEIRFSLEMLQCKQYSGMSQLLYLESKVTEFLLFFFRNLTITNTVSTKSDVIESIHDNLSNNFINPPSVQEMAKEAGMSQSGFYQAFSERYDTTPYQFIKHLKLDHAKVLLSELNKSVADTALLIGYESADAFSRAFKHKYKVNPKDISQN